MSAREIRAHLCEVRAAPEGGGLQFSGYAAKFDSLSEDLGGFREKIQRGAFADAIARDDVRCLLNHNPDHVLGRNRSGTLKLSEDEIGLKFEALAPDVQWARDLRTSVQRGDINQCSFSFFVDEERWEMKTDGPDERTLVKVHLYDVSIVTYPAYVSTEASVRSASEIYAARRRRGMNPIDLMRKRLKLKERSL